MDPVESIDSGIKRFSTSTICTVVYNDVHFASKNGFAKEKLDLV